MLTPNCMEIFTLLSGSGLIFYTWHMWRYDRFRCLKPTRQDWFRALICYVMLIAMCAFFTYGTIQMIILYDQYFATIAGVTLPRPWKMWPEKSQQLWRDSLYILTVGWAFMQAVHLEEFLYWAYLMSSIKYATGPKVSWVRSVYFKIWVVGCIASLVLLIGAVNIEKNDLDRMRAYVFLVGGAMSTVFAIFSTALCFAMPSFVRAVRAQGASYEVLDRLAFFSEMNSIRVTFRWLYSICFVVLSADGLSSAKPINKSPFGSDVVFMTGMISVFITACLSIILLLPRNMSAEALPASAQPAKMKMVAYPRPRSHSINPRGGLGDKQLDQMAILGLRLNLDREAMGGITEDLLEMPVVPKGPPSASSDNESTREMYKASQSEEHIFGQQEGMDEKETPRRGVRWSEALSTKGRNEKREREEQPPMPMSPRRQNQVWVHTETVKQSHAE